MSEWNWFRLTGRIELRRYVPGEDLTGVSVSDTDNPPTDQGWIARNPDNYDDQWYVAKEYVAKNYERSDDPQSYDPQFLVNLIRIPCPVGGQALMELARNCTPVTNHYWIFEGELEFLDVPCESIALGVVGSLGGLSTKKLIEVCKEAFDVDVTA